MNSKNFFFPVLVLLLGIGLSSTGCESDVVFRHYQLAAVPELPAGQTTIVGDRLVVEFTQVEPLLPGHSYVLWVANTYQYRAVRSGLEAGGIDVGLDEMGMPIEDVIEVAVSVEEELGVVAPTQLVLAGAPGRELTFAGLSAESFSHGSGEATIENGVVSVQAAELPALPAGHSYGVWLLFSSDGAHDDDGHHDDGGGDGGDGHEGHTHATTFSAGDHDSDDGEVHEGDLHFAGTLDGAGQLIVEEDAMLAAALRVVITVEASYGAETMSPTTILSGRAQLDTSGGGGHGDHIH